MCQRDTRIQNRVGQPNCRGGISEDGAGCGTGQTHGKNHVGHGTGRNIEAGREWDDFGQEYTVGPDGFTSVLTAIQSKAEIVILRGYERRNLERKREIERCIQRQGYLEIAIVLKAMVLVSCPSYPFAGSRSLYPSNPISNLPFRASQFFTRIIQSCLSLPMIDLAFGLAFAREYFLQGY